MLDIRLVSADTFGTLEAIAERLTVDALDLLLDPQALAATLRT
jgi:hypothetical protein